MADPLLLRRASLGGRLLDVRVRGGRIAEMRPGLEPAGEETLDLAGRLLLRGLWDEHVHFTQAALAAVRTPLGGAASAAEAVALVRAAVDATEPGEPVVGVGFQDGLWPDKPSAAALDAVTGDRITVLISHDVHAAWLNTAAARRFGVDPGTDGLLREAPAFAVGQQVGALSAGGTRRAVATLAADAVRRGVVGVVDFEMTWNLDPWLERMADGWSGPRVEAGVYAADLERAVALGVRTGSLLDPALDRLTVGPLKTLIDGALNTRTAYCADPYPDGSRGLLTVEPDALQELLARARETGFVPAVHAIGDAAVGIVLDAFEAVGIGGRMEHAQLVAEADLARFAPLGVTASVQPAHLLDDRAVAAEHWPGRTGRTYPLRSLLATGATLAFGSDAPVAPLDPWLAMRAAVDRSLPGEEPWHGEQRIPLESALAASTRGRSTPRIGDPADLIALDRPVEDLDPEAVALTLIGGDTAHRRL